MTLPAVACIPQSSARLSDAAVVEDRSTAIAEVESLLTAYEKSGLALERNGETLDNASAVRWLRKKWIKRRDAVHSAEDFIYLVADHSSETKEPYRIILPDARKPTSAEWFSDRLRELRKR